jgi:predicted NBD/HSP70 family sugar kinase
MDSTEPPVARQISLYTVVQSILSHGPTSRADLAKRTGLSKQTISDVVLELETAGWLKPHGRTMGKPGRSAVVYEINAVSGMGAAVDLGGSKLSVAICDLLGNALAETTVPTDTRGGAHVVEQVAAQIERLASQLGASAKQLKIAVLGTPGVLHPETAHIMVAPNVPGLEDVDVPRLLTDRLGVPVVIENDVNLAARGEQWRGHGAGLHNFVFIALGTGVGMGIIADGHLLRGARGAAGEIGYLPIGGDPYDPRGFALGTFEAAVGSVAIASRYAGFGGRAGATVREIFAALEHDDTAARATIEETGRLIAPAIAAVGAMLDPEMVILGGSIGIRQELIGAVQRSLPRCTPRPPRVEASILGSRAGLVGAIGVAVDRMHDTLFGVGLPASPLLAPSPRPKQPGVALAHQDSVA